MVEPRLTFEFYSNEPKSPIFKTKIGQLILNSDIANIRFAATSGMPGFDGIAQCSLKGRGAIPPCSLAGISEYSVLTSPIAMPHLKGVNGNFYPILPFSVAVSLLGGGLQRRGDFGIHWDGNVPGTAGCIGIVIPEHWVKFEQIMKQLAPHYPRIKLYVPMSIKPKSA